MSAPTPWSERDHALMGRALDAARRGLGHTRPNPAVGAVLATPQGEVLAEGFHPRAGEPHAEVWALRAARAAGVDVRGAVMYVTLEPCNHQGRTGPCSVAVQEAGVGRVVVAMRDPNPQARGGVERLRAAGIVVDVGCRGTEAHLLNPGFITHHALRRPFVTLKWAMTADGCTSTEAGNSRWITGEEARAQVHRDRWLHDAVLAGVETALADGARLTVRGAEPLPPNAGLRRRIVLDGRLRLPPDAPFFAPPEDGSGAVVFTGEDAPEAAADRLRERGATVVRVARDVHGWLPVAEVLRWCHGEGLQSLYVEGGRHVAGSFLAAGVVDRIDAWIAPRVLGGGRGALGPVALPAPPLRMAEATPMHHEEIIPAGRDFLLRGWLTKHLFPESGAPG